MKRLAQQTQEQDINHLLKVRREKLAELQQNGRDPFQITKFDQTHHSLEVKGLYEAHETELLKDRQEPNVEGMDEEQAKEALKKDYEERRNIMDASPIHVAIAGRMMFKRVMGKASFCNIQDLQGSIQVYVARDAIGTESYADFKKSDIGDIFGVEGFAFRTRTGEISIHAEKVTLLSKSLQILPEKFHGLTDVDTPSPSSPASSKSDGSVGGSSAYPHTSAPASRRTLHIQLPLKPVCPVTSTRLSL